MLSRVELARRFPVFGRFGSSLNVPLHASHRGGRHWGRENTLEVYRRAVHEARTDILEIDIWKSSDEHLVLNHDGVINGLAVKQHTVQQLREMDPQLAQLDEVLGSSVVRCLSFVLTRLFFFPEEFLSVHSLVFFFDLKDIEAIPLTMNAIKRYQLEDRVIFGAVDRAINLQLQRAKLPSMPICVDVESMTNIAQAYQRGELNAQYPFEHDILGFFLESSSRSLVTKDLLTRIHSLGKPLSLVGSLLDRPDVQREMIDLGVDILFTDRPDLLRQTLDSLSPKLY